MQACCHGTQDLPKPLFHLISLAGCQVAVNVFLYSLYEMQLLPWGDSPAGLSVDAD